jgi:hypothetical protein
MDERFRYEKAPACVRSSDRVGAVRTYEDDVNNDACLAACFLMVRHRRLL